MQDRGDSSSDNGFWDDGSGLFDDPQAIAALDARADADIAAGRLIGHQALLYWLSCWGDEDPLVRTPALLPPSPSPSRPFDPWRG